MNQFPFFFIEPHCIKTLLNQFIVWVPRCISTFHSFLVELNPICIYLFFDSPLIIFLCLFYPTLIRSTLPQLLKYSLFNWVISLFFYCLDTRINRDLLFKHLECWESSVLIVGLLSFSIIDLGESITNECFDWLMH